MLVVSLNLRHGGGPRSKVLLDWIQTRTPDILVLLEWRDNPVGNKIKACIVRSGLLVATAAGSGEKSNGVLVAAKAINDALRLTPNGSGKGELLAVNVGSNVRLLAAYFPQSKAKAPFFNSCMAEALSCNQMPFLLVGDLNTGRNDLDIEGSGTPFHCEDLFRALESQARLADLWRGEHGMKQEWTWRSPRNGFRIDHAFSNRQFLDKYPSINCFYDHSLVKWE